jgi:hypothetical protein
LPSLDGCLPDEVGLDSWKGGGLVCCRSSEPRTLHLPSDGVPGISDYANFDVRGPGRKTRRVDLLHWARRCAAELFVSPRSHWISKVATTWGAEHGGEGGSGLSHANSQDLLHGEQRQVQKFGLCCVQLASPTRLGLLAGMVWQSLGRNFFVLRINSTLGTCRRNTVLCPLCWLWASGGRRVLQLYCGISQGWSTIKPLTTKHGRGHCTVRWRDLTAG